MAILVMYFSCMCEVRLCLVSFHGFPYALYYFYLFIYYFLPPLFLSLFLKLLQCFQNCIQYLIPMDYPDFYGAVWISYILVRSRLCVGTYFYLTFLYYFSYYFILIEIILWLALIIFFCSSCVAGRIILFVCHYDF